MLQFIEADRICNSHYANDSETLTAGVQKNNIGAPIAYHILKTHPGNLYGKFTNEWFIVPTINEQTGQLALVPTNLMDVFNAAISSPVLSGAESNDLATSRNFSLDYAVNPRLPWDNQFMLFRTDGSVAPFIRQEETPVELKVIANGSEEEFKSLFKILLGCDKML